MKRTLKRESKVLEIVRREAIGAGGSRDCSGCSVAPPVGRVCGSRGVPRVKPGCPRPVPARREPRTQPEGEPASIPTAVDGHRGPRERARRAGLAAVSRRCDPVCLPSCRDRGE